MIQFYMSILFLGILLIVSAFLWILFDRKKVGDDSKRLEEKKDELIRVIEDSEQMLEELNKFSDYIVTQVNVKNEELNSTLQVIESRLQQSNFQMESNHEKQSEESKPFNEISDPVDEILKPMKHPVNMQAQAIHTRLKEKVIPINSKHRDVINLASSGLHDDEIAKALNIGKGEIRLILGLNSNRAKVVND